MTIIFKLGFNCTPVDCLLVSRIPRGIKDNTRRIKIPLWPFEVPLSKQSN